jgi:hypothetical protein
MKTAELTGAQLDYWVAKAEGKHPSAGARGDWEPLGDSSTRLYDVHGSIWSPSANWEQGGPIIERERIAIQPGAPDTGNWMATNPTRMDWAIGPTPLISAMRAFVASKYGHEVPDA